jgi:hypothetical protein
MGTHTMSIRFGFKIGCDKGVDSVEVAHGCAGECGTEARSQGRVRECAWLGWFGRFGWTIGS